MGKIVETFGRRLPGSISEMMPDYGCFVQAWTTYGIVVPLVEHIFGVEPDAARRRVVFEPHIPAGWEGEAISIEDLPVGTNLISFTRSRTGDGIEYRLTSKDDGWRFVLRPPERVRYVLNGHPVKADSAGVRLSGRQNRILIVPR
jgi:hypothetical protein